MGHEVVLLEGTKRAGGRVLTARGPWAHKQYVEWGATRIADIHDHTLHYVKLFGLELDEFGPNPRAAHFYSGARYDHPSRGPLPSAWKLDANEIKLGLDGIKALPYKDLDQLGDPLKSEWLISKEAQMLGGLSFTQYLSTLKLSTTAKNINRFDAGSDADHYNAALWQAQTKLLANWGRTYKIKNGNDQLPEAFAKALTGKIFYDCKVHTIHRTDKAVSVFYLKNGEQQTLIADGVVLTVSPAILKEIAFTPELSMAKQVALKKVSMGSVIKTTFSMRERFWHKEGLSGLCVGYSDLPVERIYDLTASQAGSGGILMSYSQHASADKYRALEESKRNQKYFSYLKQIFPEAPKYLDAMESFDWNAQDWVKGSWASFTGGDLEHFAALKATESRLCFAGDHTSYHCGWMQGALESGRRAATEIAGS